jgi:UDP:flavonoid glycosyltransferase YjiC (YdhE family)
MSAVAIAAVGSRGDVAPLTGVGVRLQQAGHNVVMAAYTPFADLITGCGLQFRELPVDFSPGADHIRGSAVGSVAKLYGPNGVIFGQTGEALLTALRDEPLDALLLSPLSEPVGHPLAEVKGIPAVGLRLQPLSATGAYPPAVLGAWSAGAFGNRRIADAATWMVDRLYHGVVARFRAELGLPNASARALRRVRTAANWPILHGYSPTLLPRPVDWRPGLEVVGYWWPAPNPRWQPPRELTEFLAAGPPPVFISLGSTVTTADRSAQLSDMIADALQKAGVRGVVQCGWAGLKVGGADVLTIGDTPHDWLFPRMAAVAHHCGAGTTAAALRAGVPSIAIPGPVGDQPFWAQRLRRLGATAATIPYRALSVDRLTEAIRTAVDDQGLRDSAAQFAGRLAGEDGAAHAVAVVERLLNETTH